MLSSPNPPNKGSVEPPDDRMDAAISREVVEGALRRGEPLLAFDAATRGLEAAPGDVRLRQLQALALARAGAPDRATRILEALRKEGHQDEETLGLLARIRKDAALAAPTPEERSRRMRASFQLYLQAYESTGGYYTGINAATLALLCGEARRSRALAAEVGAIARRALEGGEDGPASYYPLATVAEAALLEGRDGEAAAWLERAARAAGDRYGDLASTRRNVRLILEAQGRDRALVDAWLPIPRVGLVYGGSAVWPESAAGRVEPQLRAELDSWLEENRIEFGYGTGAPGVDLLFSEAVGRRGGRSYLVLPYHGIDAGALPGGSLEFWARRAERVLAAADETVVATEQHYPGTRAFERFAEELRLGLALVHARLLETELMVLDVRRGAGSEQREIDRISLQQVKRRTLVLPDVPDGAVGRARQPPARVGQEGEPGDGEASDASRAVRIAGVLFADVLKYSALEDRQIPLFVEHFLGLVGGLAGSSAHRPLARNTWGDGLYFVFSNARDAGLFALELQEAVAATDWGALGLRDDLSLRIGLHAGPVFGCSDPVTGSPMFTGRHTVRAARIEPVTPPGMIYGSREFAALSTAEQVEEYACEPVGRIDLAKGAASLPLYVVRRAPARDAPRAGSPTAG